MSADGLAVGPMRVDEYEQCVHIAAEMPDGFTIGPMRVDEYERCVDIAAKAFTTDNPTVAHTGIPPEVFKRMARGDVPVKEAVESGLSLVARSTADGSPLAFLFLRVMDLSHDAPEEVWDLHGGGRVLKEALDQVYEKAIASPWSGLAISSMLQGKTMHCMLGGTFPGVKSRGMGKALRLRAVEVAREHGMNTLIVEPGHGATRHIWTQHCGAKIISEIELDSFKSKSCVLGERPLRGVPGTISVAQVTIRKSIWDSSACWPCAFCGLMKLLGAKKKE